MAFYRMSGSSKGELHGASILVTTEDESLKGQAVDLLLGASVVKSGVFSTEGTVLFTDILEIGNYTAKCGDISSDNISVSGDDIINKVTKTTFISSSGIELTLGNTYTFGGYDWTCAEDKGKYYVLQSQGVTSGSWAGYSMSGNLTNANGNTIDVGGANIYYNGNIDGYDISGYNTTMYNLYDSIKYAEKSGDYGKGLFLVSNDMCGTTTSGMKGSGNYWSALKTASTNYRSFGAVYNLACLGTVHNINYIWSVDSNGNGHNDYSQVSSLVVAPAFNLDKTKVKLIGYNEIVSVDTPDRLYLYDSGNEFIDVTGGWSNSGYSNTSGYGSMGNVVKNSNNMYLGTTTTGVTIVYIVGTQNKIDLTGYSKLCIQADVVGSVTSNPNIIKVSTDKTAYYSEWEAYDSFMLQNGSGVQEFDISSYNDARYIVLAVINSRSTTSYRIYLEK